MIASPCRPSRDAKPHPHACSAYHAQLVNSYRDARLSWEAQREAATYGYATEAAEWSAAHPGPTFRSWLTAHTTRED